MNGLKEVTVGKVPLFGTGRGKKAHGLDYRRTLLVPQGIWVLLRIEVRAFCWARDVISAPKDQRTH